MPRVERKFDPEWDLVYLLDANQHRYAVVKKPDVIPGYVPEGMKEEDVDPDTIYVQEGIIVHADGRYYYFKLRKPMDYDAFKAGRAPFDGRGRWMDIDDDPRFSPDFIFTARINSGAGTVGHPAPRFVPDIDDGENNWIGFDDGMSPPLPQIIPDYVTSEMLDDLILGHLMLSEYLQEGVENPKNPKKAA
jgi:hypothetical protein